MSVTYTDIYLIKMHFSVISVISSHPSISLFIWYLFDIIYLFILYTPITILRPVSWCGHLGLVSLILPSPHYLSSSFSLFLTHTLTVMIFPTRHSRLPHPPSTVTLFRRMIAHITCYMLSKCQVLVLVVLLSVSTYGCTPKTDIVHFPSDSFFGNSSCISPSFNFAAECVG